MAIKKTILGNVIGPRGPQGPQGEPAPTTIDILCELSMNSIDIDGTISLEKIAHNGNTMVILTNNGIKYNKGNFTDNNDWMDCDIPENPLSSPRSVTYGNNKFVAVGSNGHAIYSRDGIYWSSYQMNLIDINKEKYHLNDVIYVDGRFTVCGDGGFMAFSTDGLSWTVIDHGINNGRTNCLKIAYGNGIYIIIGDTDCVYRSTDGLSWKLHTRMANKGNIGYIGVTYANGKFVAVRNGICSYSTDGITWTTVETDILYGARDVIYAYEKFIACGSYYSLMFSDDGVNWSKSWELIDSELIDSELIGNGSASMIYQNITYVENIGLFMASNYGSLCFFNVVKETKNIYDVIAEIYRKVIYKS